MKWLIAAISGLCALGWLVNTQEPNRPIIYSLFFSIIFCITYSIAFFLTNIVRRSLILASGVVGFFLLRLVGLREPIYILLLGSCLISLELYLQKR